MSADESVAEGRFKWIEYKIQQAISRAIAGMRAAIASANHNSVLNGGTVGPATTVNFQQGASAYKPIVSGVSLVGGVIGGTGVTADTITCRLTANGTPIGPTVIVDVDAEGNFAATFPPWVDNSGTVGVFIQYGVRATSGGSAVTIPAGRAAITSVELSG